jgi:hypothetical protein
LPLRPAALAANPGGGPGQLLSGGRGALGIPSMPARAMISMIAGWIIGWPAIGAWRMMTRPPDTPPPAPDRDGQSPAGCSAGRG